MDAVELFAGAGGAALGLHAAGVEHLRCIEWDKDAAATLAAAGFPAVCGDVRDLSLYAGLDPDLVWSSFPCQCWSTAGKRLGPEDERNGWPWTVDAIDAMRPRWFAAENVTGLLTHRGGCESRCLGPEECPRAYFDLVILAQLRERFAWVGFRVPNASSFGVPQHRRRLIIVAGPRPIDWPAPTHGKPSGQCDLFGRSLLPWATVGEALGLGGTVAVGRSMAGDPKHPATSTDEPIATLGTNGNTYSIQGSRVIGGGRNPQSAADAHLRSYRDLTDEPCTTITAEQIGNAGPWIDLGGTQPELLDTKGGGEGASPQKMQRAGDALFLATSRRRLTVQECAILQDFPPDHPWQGNKQSQYRQVGNAVPPTLARVVVEAVIKADKGQA